MWQGGRRTHKLLMLALVLFSFGWTATFGQTPTAWVTGRVTDPTGAVIPGARITVTDLEKRVERTARSNEVGYYEVPFLQPGNYGIAVQAQGFRPTRLERVALEVGQSARFDFAMEVGQVTEVLEVRAAPSLIQAERTDTGQVIDGARVVEMPLNGRNYLQLAQFTVGVLPGFSSPGSGERTAREGGFVAVGTHAQQNNVLLDGADNSSRESAAAMGYQAQVLKPSVDAISEFKVITNNTSAEFGYRLGAKVLVSTKAGTNQFHGSLYEFLRNNDLDGTNFFANRSGAKKPAYHQNQFGGTLGGPVIKNTAFFFASYQGTRIRQGRSFISSVPSLDALNGDFSQQPASRRNVFDPLTISGTGAGAIRLPFPNNRIPSTRFDPVAQKVASLYPAPNITGREHMPSNFFRSPSNTEDPNQYDFRGDQYFKNNHHVFARYSIRDEIQIQNGSLPQPADGGGQSVDLKAWQTAANYDATLTSTMYNQARFSWSSFKTNFGVLQDKNLNPVLGIKGAPGDSINDGNQQGYSNLAVSGFTSLGPGPWWPQVNNMDNLLIADSLIVQKGLHTLKFGGEYRRVNIFRTPSTLRRGQFSFSGTYTAQQPNVGSSRAQTGNGLADMLLGWSNSISYANPPVDNTITPYHGFFIQDDWKVTPRLTVNAGLRWELFVNPYFPHPEKQTSTRYLTPEVNGVSPGQETWAVPKDGRDCGCVEDFNNFGPRLGIAYRVTENTVIRAGAGLYYGEADAIEFQQARFFQGPPLVKSVTQVGTNESTTLFVQNGFPPIPPGTDLPFGVSVYTFPYFQPNYSAGQWFFDVQQNLPGKTLLTVAYNGAATSHLDVQRDINLPFAPSATVPASQRKVRPQFGSVIARMNMLSASYQALTVKAERRLSAGFTFLSSLTYSHNIDYASEDFLLGPSGRATPYDLRRERANSDLDRRLTYNLSALYELPLGKGRNWLRSGPASWVLGGWQTGGILSLVSGTPVDSSINVDNQNLGGVVRGDWARNPNLPGSQRSIDHWFDTGFVVPSRPGVISNAGRNLIYGPHRRNLDVVVARNFVMPWEGHQLQFRFESFNFTNTPYFGRPNTNVGSPTAGQITSADEPRRVQFALKYVF